MKFQFKPIIIILVTLFIGVGLGILTTGFFFKKRVDRFTRVARKEGFIRHHFEILEVNEIQRSQLKPILEKHYTALESHREAIRSQIDSMRKEIRPYLTEEQIQKLKERRMKRRPGRRGRHHPPPPGPDSAGF